MGTETPMNAVWQIIDMATGVKLNNPPMGTETYRHHVSSILGKLF